MKKLNIKFDIKNRKLLGTIIGIIAFVILLIGATYALYKWSSGEEDKTNFNLTVTSQEIAPYIVYNPGTPILSSDNSVLQVGSNYTDGINSTIEFWKNGTTRSIFGQISLEVLQIGNNIKQTDTLKWALTTYNINNSTEVLLEEGTFNGRNKGDIFPIYTNFDLNNYQTFYKVYLWIDGDAIDSNKMISNEVISIEISSQASDTANDIPIPGGPIDSSGANFPDLVDGLIPVVYNETTAKWVKADITSSTSTYGWYDYTQKKWANAVLVNEEASNCDDGCKDTITKKSRLELQNASAGTEISMDDILAFYVWIPRYTYKVWNKDKVVGTDSYNARTTGIDITFENGIDTTGTIVCNDYSYRAPSSTAGSPNETCTGANGDYYTHPAFNFGGYEVKGFWIGKYELSSETPTASNGGGSSTTLTARILPNVNSWRNNSVSNFSTVIQSMQTTNNIYGLSTDKLLADSHMLTNMEWGAVAYLTNSNYGRCSGGTCTEITINNCNTYTTGIGGDTVSAGNSSTTCTTDANKYNGAKGVLASTTGNVYGVYDMSGGAFEYVMGNMSSTADTYTFYSSSAGFASSWYSNYSNQKYVNIYAKGSTYTDQTAYNRARLGDATGEVVLSTGGTGGGWYSDNAHFPSSSNSWFERGGRYSNSSAAGVLGFDRDNGYAVSYVSARAALLWYS